MCLQILGSEEIETVYKEDLGKVAMFGLEGRANGVSKP